MARVAVVGGSRTAFVKAGGAFSKYSFLDLGTAAVFGALQNAGVKKEHVEELVFSTVLLDPRMPNAAREIVLRSDLPDTLSAHFISNNCISGLVAATFLRDAIQTGRISCGIAGGSESMSNPALTVHPQAEDIFLRLARARTFGQRLSLLAQLRPAYFLPRPPSPKEPSTGMTMGQHCEITAKEFSIKREDQDVLALASHSNAATAREAGLLEEEIVEYGGVKTDNIIRKDTSLDKLSGLRPVFDRSGSGTLTAGNSSPLTDGASAVVLMSEDAARSSGANILGFIEDVSFAAINPDAGLLMAPGLALPELMHRNDLRVDDVDYFEIHEAFAAQVLSNMQVWESGWERFPAMKPIGSIPREKVNVNGGSIAIGHPFAATGGRLILSLLNQLQRSGTQTGIISVCAAGAMACAMLLRRE